MENTIEKSDAQNESVSVYKFLMGLDRTRSVLSRINSKFKSRAGNLSPLFKDTVDLDKILIFFAESNKFFNSHSKYSRINKLTRTFNNLFKSKGALNFAVMINLWSSWATIFDATSNFIRVNEVRFIAKNEDKTATPSIALEDVRLLLSNTNYNLAVASELIEAVACDSEFGCTTRNDIDQPDGQAERPDVQNEAYFIQINDEDSKSERMDSYSVEKVQKAPQPPPVSPRDLFSQVKLDSHPSDIRRINLNLQSYLDTNRRFHLPAANDDDVAVPVSSRKRTKRRILPADYYTRRLVGWLNTTNQYLNYNSNHTHFDKFMKEFVDTMNTPGYLAINIFSTMFATLWTVIDAATNVWRFMEIRIRDGILWNRINSFPDPLTEFQSELEDANSNLADFSSLVNEVLCDFDADIARCFTQKNGIQAANARADKSITRRMFYVPPVGYKAKNRRNYRRRNPRNNPQSTQVNHGSNQVKFNSNNNRQAVSKNGRRFHAINQQTINYVNSSRKREAVYQTFPIKQNENPIDARGINSKPNIQINRNFLYSAAAYNNKPAYSHRRTKRRIIPDDYYIGKFTNWTNMVNKNLNSNSNNTKLDRFISSFNYLFRSPGFYSINLFYTIFQSLWTVADASGNIVRSNELRIRDGLNRKTAASTPDPLEELQYMLIVTNSNLQKFLKLANSLPCDLNADAEEGCLTHKTGIEAKNSNARKGSIHFRRPTVDRSTRRRNNRRNNLLERNTQSIPTNNENKFYPNNSRQAAVNRIRQTSHPVSQHTRNHVANSRVGESARQIYPTSQSKNVRANTRPSIKTSRHFFYKFNYSNITSNNNQHKFKLPFANGSHPRETGHDSNVPNNYQAIRHIIHPTSQNGSSVVDVHSSLIQTRRHITSAIEDSYPVNDQQIHSQALTGVYRNLNYPASHDSPNDGNDPINHHQKHTHHQRSKVGMISHRLYPTLNQKLIKNRPL